MTISASGEDVFAFFAKLEWIRGIGLGSLK